MDRTLPAPVRVRLRLPLGYLALPFDLVPDFLPVIGYADNAIITACRASLSRPSSGANRDPPALAWSPGRARRPPEDPPASGLAILTDDG